MRPLNRGYVAHARGGEVDQALCGRRGVVEGPERRGGILVAGTDRFAKGGEPVMCNACQRAAWRIEQAKRRAK